MLNQLKCVRNAVNIKSANISECENANMLHADAISDRQCVCEPCSGAPCSSPIHTASINSDNVHCTSVIESRPTGKSAAKHPECHAYIAAEAYCRLITWAKTFVVRKTLLAFCLSKYARLSWLVNRHRTVGFRSMHSNITHLPRVSLWFRHSLTNDSNERRSNDDNDDDDYYYY